MQGRANTGVGIKAVKQSDTSGKKIISREYLWPEILSAGKKDVDGHGNHLSNDDIGLQTLEAVYIVQQKVSEGENNERIPKNIRYQKPLTEWYHIIQPHVHRCAVFSRDQIFCEEVQNKVTDPTEKQLQMGESRLMDPGEPEFSVVYNGCSHCLFDASCAVLMG